MPDDSYWMQQALIQAEKAQAIDEVPVGAIIVKDKKIIAGGFNQVIKNSDPSAHAEIQALRKAGVVKNNYRLVGSTLYVTLEPCMMCVGAMVHARIKRLVFGAFDHKTGMVETADCCFDKAYHNHRVETLGGVLEEQCAQVLKDFFKNKRTLKAKIKNK